MRTRDLGRNVELKVQAVRLEAIAEFDHPFTALFLELLGEQRIKHRVKGLISIFEDNDVPKAHCIFDDSRHKFLLSGRLDDLNTLFAALGIAQLDQPLVSLHLWVNHKAPAV